MEISGFQKFSMLDFPGHLASIVFTQGCNFQCVYCHNEELIQIRQGLIEEKKVMSYLERRKYFLDGLVITGGEPTLQEDLPDFCRKIKRMGLKVKLDTNGSSPEMLEKLIDGRLIDYVAMDVKAPWRKYCVIIRKKGYEELCRESMEIVRMSGIGYEFRTTVCRERMESCDIDNIRSILNPGEKFRLQEAI